MQSLIKWPGGKTGELEIIKKHMPTSFDNYIEPFFGGGAVFFDICPKTAIINDISKNLMNFYSLIGSSDKEFHDCLFAIYHEWESLKTLAKTSAENLLPLYAKNINLESISDDFKKQIDDEIKKVVSTVTNDSKLVFSVEMLNREITRTVFDKIRRTMLNEKKIGTLSDADRTANIITGFTAGYYMYMRNVLNAIDGGLICFSHGFTAAAFFFVREFCYGSMFRYNSRGEFNIPYGGIAYNNKDFLRKIENIFNDNTVSLLASTKVFSEDFEYIFSLANRNDFIFLDPPYDSDFSDYEYNAFGKSEHLRLAECIYSSSAKLLLIIKNTPFIYSLYEGRGFNIYAFDNSYAYCVKGRNDRKAEHLIITNY